MIWGSAGDASDDLIEAHPATVNSPGPRELMNNPVVRLRCNE
jgi:hypothetical protein